MQHNPQEPGSPRYSSGYIKKIRKTAGHYDLDFSDRLNKMLGYSEHRTSNLELIIEADKTFCELMLEAMHDKKMPDYVIKFYSEMYNSVRAVLDKKDYQAVKYLREYLK